MTIMIEAMDANHDLFKPEDFTSEELDRRNSLAVLVIEGGLGVCKVCGASEAELEEHPTCVGFKVSQKKQRFMDAERVVGRFTLPPVASDEEIETMLSIISKGNSMMPPLTRGIRTHVDLERARAAAYDDDSDRAMELMAGVVLGFICVCLLIVVWVVT